MVILHGPAHPILNLKNLKQYLISKTMLFEFIFHEEKEDPPKRNSCFKRLSG